VIADLQARLFQAVATNNLAEARRLNDRIHPVASVFYADPFVDMHNRKKEALVILGRLPRAVMRPPLVKISDPEIARIPISGRRIDCIRTTGRVIGTTGITLSECPVCTENLIRVDDVKKSPKLAE
jgi:dihydrodipicolinate synthase/N-acetylneuraminate lyase